MAGISNMYDVEIPADAPQSPIYDEHANFVLKFNQDKEDYEFVMSDFLRINAVYWSVTALELLGKHSEVEELKEEVI